VRPYRHHEPGHLPRWVTGGAESRVAAISITINSGNPGCFPELKEMGYSTITNSPTATAIW